MPDDSDPSISISSQYSVLRSRYTHHHLEIHCTHIAFLILTFLMAVFVPTSRDVDQRVVQQAPGHSIMATQATPSLNGIVLLEAHARLTVASSRNSDTEKGLRLK